LINEKEEINYGRISNLGRKCSDNLAAIQRFAKEEERGRIAGGRIAVETTLLLSRGSRTSQANRKERRNPVANSTEEYKGYREIIKEQETLLEKYAKYWDFWYEYGEFTSKRKFFDHGDEATVYLDTGGKTVKKIIVYNANYKVTPLEFIDNRIALHNYLFPETKYTLHGFTLTQDGRFAFILNQDYIKENKDALPLTYNAVADYLNTKLNMNLYLKSIQHYYNEMYLLNDIHLKNVINGKNGVFYFIDTQISLNTPNTGMGGFREYGDYSLVSLISEKTSTFNDYKKAIGNNTKFEKKLLTFDDYKARISIIQVAESLGYKFDPKDGKVSPVYKTYDAHGNKLHEIVIKNPNNNSTQYYFDRNNNKGDLISFIKNNIDKFPQFHDANQYRQINNILAYYSGTEYLQNRQHDTFRNAEKFDVSKFKTVQSTVKDFHYLRDNRKISENTINTFLPFIKRIKEIETTEKPKTFINIAFPYNIPGKNDIVNFELRNYDFKGFPENGNKKDAVWMANFASSVGNEVKNIYIAESAIDAMSAYELNKENINISESCFCSTGGNLIDTQILNLQQAHPAATVIGCYDNDLQGNIYDIRTYCLLNNVELKIVNENDSGNVKFGINSTEFSIKKENVTLNTFLEKSGKKSAENYKVEKSADGFKDFNDQLKKNASIKISSKNTEKVNN
jgi:hypothetical protein